MTIENRMETAEAAMVEARTAGDGDAFLSAFDEHHAAEEERDAIRVEAIGRGIDMRRVFETASEIDALGREALTTFLQTLIEIMEERDDSGLADLTTEAGRLVFLEEYASILAETPLWVKLMAAFYVEGDLTDGAPVADGAVAQAVDRAVEQILPYVTRGSGGWYNMNVVPKL